MTSPTTTADRIRANRHELDAERVALLAMYPPNTEPMPDTFAQFIHVLEIMWVLHALYGSRTDTVIGGNVFVYYREGDPRSVLAPDVFIVFGVDRDEVFKDNSYFVWRAGKPPSFVLEVGSKSTAQNDLTDKRDKYASMNVLEYWMFDPTGGDHYGFALRGERLVNGVYQRIEMIDGPGGTTRGHSDLLGLDLCWEDEKLRVYDPATGEYFLDQRETVSRAEAAVAAQAHAEAAQTHAQDSEARAQDSEARAQDSEARAEAAEAEIERLRDLLRNQQR